MFYKNDFLPSLNLNSKLHCTCSGFQYTAAGEDGLTEQGPEEGGRDGDQEAGPAAWTGSLHPTRLCLLPKLRTFPRILENLFIFCSGSRARQ